MNGVDILSVEQIAVAFKFDSTTCRWLLVIGLIFGVIVGAIGALATKDIRCLVAGIISGVFAGLVAGITISWLAAIPTEYVTQYRVTISDEVSLTEFNAKYEIIDIEDKIYTVREREP